MSIFNRRNCSRILILCTAAIACGCSTFTDSYMRYERPELFFPTTAKVRQQLDLGTAQGGQQQQRQQQQPQQQQQQQPQQPQPATGLSVIHPVEIPASSTQSYDIIVSDTCESGAPQLSVYPPQTVTKTLEREGQGQWYKTTLDAKTLQAFVGDIELVVRSCRAAGLSMSDAARADLLKRIRIPVGYKRLTTSFNIWATDDIGEEFGIEFARTFLVADVVFENPNSQPVLIYGSSLQAELRFLAAVEDVKRVLGEQAIKQPSLLDTVYWGKQTVSDALDFKENYRPLAYPDILAIFTNQKESDPRQRTVSSLKSLGELAAGAAVFVTGPDYGAAVSLFTGILIPELEKQLLWDVLLHVKNLEARSLKEVEEIPAHGQLRRAVFFPRRALPGFLPPFPMYIAEVRPGDFPATAVIVDKKATISSE